MADDIKTQFGNFWSGLRKKATEVVENQESGYVRGRVAARPVLDADGELIVDAGQTVDETMVTRARAAGRLGALVGATVAAQAHDVREKAKHLYESTPEGTEARSLASSEQYIEARHYIGWKVALDITDIRGNVIVPAGRQIDDDDVRAVREAGQLGALIDSAQQAGPPALSSAAPAYMPYSDVSAPPVTGQASEPAPPTGHRTARPLASYYEDEVPEESKE